ncbi:UPF0496 protein At3g19330-like [Nymphaea colorata]|uniref:UPF0496 protein At3g19330-like n=1 Tax=Nymphaea colorata TaxID=210225 RepID=UPI00129D447F|nr:UPF0496 protein At3g19330-like [Nymphaea colorata]
MSCFAKLRNCISQHQEDRQPHHLSPETASPAPPPIDSAEDEQSTSFASTSATTSVVSPTLNLDVEYVRALQTESYNEIWSKIQQHQQEDQCQSVSTAVDQARGTGPPPSTLISAAHILKPDPDAIVEAIRSAGSLRGVTSTATLTLISSFFRSSEQASSLCILLLHSVRKARAIYASIYDVIDLLPSDSDSDGHAAASQRDFISDRLLTFVESTNPFPSPPEAPSLQEMYLCFSQLRGQLDLSLGRTKRKRRLMKRLEKGLAFCLIGATAAVIASAMAVAAHSLVAIVAALMPPLNSLFFFPNGRLLSPKIAQLDAAAKGAFALSNNFITIDRLVSRLSDNFKDDKYRIKKALDEAGSNDGRFYPCLIHKVLKLISKNRSTFQERLSDLEEHVCICFASLNRTRSDLLRQILQCQEQPTRPTATS